MVRMGRVCVGGGSLDCVCALYGCGTWATGILDGLRRNRTRIVHRRSAVKTEEPNSLYIIHSYFIRDSPLFPWSTGHFARPGEREGRPQGGGEGKEPEPEPAREAGALGCGLTGDLAGERFWREVLDRTLGWFGIECIRRSGDPGPVVLNLGVVLQG